MIEEIQEPDIPDDVLELLRNSPDRKIRIEEDSPNQSPDEWLILVGTNDGRKSGIHKVAGEWVFEGDPAHFLQGMRDSEHITQRVNERRIAELEAEVERLRETIEQVRRLCFMSTTSYNVSDIST